MSDVSVRTAWTVLDDTDEVLRLLRTTHARVLLSEADADLDVNAMFETSSLWAGVAADSDAFQDELGRQCAEHLGVARVISVVIDPVLGSAGEVAGVALRVEVQLTPASLGRKSAGAAPAPASTPAPAARPASPVSRSKSAPSLTPAAVPAPDPSAQDVSTNPVIDAGPPRLSDTPVLAPRKNRAHGGRMAGTPVQLSELPQKPADAATLAALVSEQWAAPVADGLAFHEATLNLQRGHGATRYIRTDAPRLPSGPPQVREG